MNDQSGDGVFVVDTRIAEATWFEKANEYMGTLAEGNDSPSTEAGYVNGYEDGYADALAQFGKVRLTRTPYPELLGKLG